MKDPFLSDPDNLHYSIVCLSCKEPLWTSRILKRSGSHVISTETLPTGKNKAKFCRQLEKCPLCGDVFYATNGRGQSYLIKDENSGITRII